MSFYRDSSGLEIDLVLERGTDLVLVEAKSAQTPSGQLVSAFERFAAALDKPAAPRVAGRVVVYGGDESQKRSQGQILSWREIDAFDWTGS
jgi:hypothetical protein